MTAVASTWTPDFPAAHNVSYAFVDGVLERTTVEQITACGLGHLFTPENTVIRRGGLAQPQRLVCRACERKRSRDHKRRKREGVVA